MYYFRYPLSRKVPGYAKDHIVVATTRPETMLGDTGVAVHPEDERYQPLIKAGAKVRLPLVGREIPIVADEYSDPGKGTGAVKITPAHDFNDFEVGKRQKLRVINVLDEHGCMLRDGPNEYPLFRALENYPLETWPNELKGVDRFDARKFVVSAFAALALLEKIEPTTHTVPHGDRSGVAIEPWLTDQWYVNAGALAKEALAAVKGGKTRFIPERFANDYYRWLENIQPWCISRQLWWGHQIPAWYGPDGKVFVAHDEAEASALAKQHYRQDVPLTRDEDVLDTWFSSALWPFSTLGWPDKTPEVVRYYPTSVLVTGFDIIFFWVARMMMMGCHFMKDVPFRDVVIHGLVRDGAGNKMSKTRGNVIDPLDIIDGIGLDALNAKRTAGLSKEQANRVEKEVRREFPEGIRAYGTDALRFTMAAMAAQGSDVKLSIDRVEGYRNFATKVWNAARFAEQNECVRQRDFDPRTLKETVNRWIAGETERAVASVTAGIEAYKLNEAAGAAYEFVWGTFCDWYLELVKPVLMGDEENEKVETRATVAWVLDQVLKMLHPFMPFITEELWAHMVEHGVARRSLLCLSEWPKLSGLADAKADAEISWVVRLVSEIRSVRSEMTIPAAAKVPLVLAGASESIRAWAREHDETVRRLARLESITFAKSAPKGSALIVAGETTAAIPLAGVIDMGEEQKRLEKEIGAAESDIAKMDAKLDNPSFIERAKPEAIAEARARKSELEAAIKRWKAALKRLEA
jgi:valyl-tRNA synthetase